MRLVYIAIGVIIGILICLALGALADLIVKLVEKDKETPRGVRTAKREEEEFERKLQEQADRGLQERGKNGCRDYFHCDFGADSAGHAVRRQRNQEDGSGMRTDNG